MRKLTRRILPLFLSLALCLGMVPPAALAADTEPQEGTEACICDTLCTEGGVNADCPVCGAVGADLTQCLGTDAQDNEGTGTDAPEGEDTGTDAPDAEGGEAGEQPDQPDGVADIDTDVAAVQAMIDALPTADSWLPCPWGTSRRLTTR